MATTVVVVTHELRSIERISDHLVMLADGAVAAQGTPEEVRGTGNAAVDGFFERHAASPGEATPGEGLASLLLPRGK